jgi:predicted enzyme related to lactoylglutathione lyase
LEKAKCFYEDVFNWRVEANFPGPRYWSFETGNVGGAFSGDRKPAAQSVVLVISVGDIDATLERIVAAGGTLKQPRSSLGPAVPGSDAYFLDPNGNEMGLYSDR